MDAWHKACRNKFRRGVGALMAQQPREYMGMRAFGTLAVRRWYRLVDFDASQPALEHAMRIGRQDHPHRAVAGLEQRSPGPLLQRRDDVRIAGANARIKL